MARQPLVGQDPLIIKALLSHSDTPQSVGLLWTSDEPDAENLYLTTQNIHKRQTSMPLEGFETGMTGRERPQTRAVHRAATGIGLPIAIRKVPNWKLTKKHTTFALS